jgi:hypothetical protein
MRTKIERKKGSWEIRKREEKNRRKSSFTNILEKQVKAAMREAEYQSDSEQPKQSSHMLKHQDMKPGEVKFNNLSKSEYNHCE